MGDPKKNRRKYSKPRNKWQKERIEKELTLLGKYGLRNKKEIWILQTMLSKFRGRARELLSLSEEEMELGIKELSGRLHKMGLLPENAKIDGKSNREFILKNFNWDIHAKKLYNIYLKLAKLS